MRTTAHPIVVTAVALLALLGCERESARQGRPSTPAAPDFAAVATPPTPATSGYAEVNGARHYHYQVRGDLKSRKTPLLMLHGSSAAEKAWAVSHGASAGSVADEVPQPTVSVQAFALAKYDVTRGEYEAFVLDAQADVSRLNSLARASSSVDSAVRKFVRIGAPRVVLAHVRVIDGTGAPASDDRNVTIEGGRITAIMAGADVSAGDGTVTLDLRGYSVMPGIVGMHNHLTYLASTGDGPAQFEEMSYSAPRLYLANGVTTMRTAASVSPYADIKLKRAIEAGALPGPHLDLTSPFLDGAGNSNQQMVELTGPDDARETVAFWADRGMTSFKAYTHITRAELGAMIAEAHRRGLKVTGHLCSVTYEEAADLGIDNLEHGFFVNTASDPDKTPDKCSASQGDYTLEHMTPDGADAKRLIATLVTHHVALTSTLPGLAATVARTASNDGGPALRSAIDDAMSPSARDAYRSWRNRPKPKTSNAALLLRKDMDLERAFVAAGGLLMAGSDPVGIGGLVPGFADQREIELLVEAGFTPLEAIRIATLNGATFLGRQDRIGSIAVGKNADLVVMKGDPSTRITDIENVEIVFKDGVGYDTNKLLMSAKGTYGAF
jgi:imidazolonepropionase-like amidohydrolase